MEYKTIPCTEDDEELIDGKLTEINHAVVPPCEGTEEEELVFKIENGEGTVIAGCNVGIDNWQFAILDILWVDEKYRGQGLGSALIREAEKAARERNCYAMLLGTYDFICLAVSFKFCSIIDPLVSGDRYWLPVMKKCDSSEFCIGDAYDRYICKIVFFGHEYSPCHRFSPLFVFSSVHNLL